MRLIDKHSSLCEDGKKEPEDVRQQIIDISVSTNVISRFTTFAVVDPVKIGKLLCSLNIFTPYYGLHLISPGFLALLYCHSAIIGKCIMW